MKKAWLAFAIVLALIGYSLYSISGSKKEEKAKVGFHAPNFSLIGLDGKTYHLSEINKPVLINFWASWCGPCRAETPVLIRLYKKYNGKFEILAVNVTANDKQENAKKFAAFFQIPFPVLFDKNGDITEKYQVAHFPTNVFINEDGEIIHIADGILPPETLENIIQKMVGE
ncbi:MULTISPECIES: TlpA family protein disulfide reductase [Aneurinibacillus]|jgi:cytochrome c biogenesis protein CcmG/thiol:disulfide interchange protein DsbE|uniref:Thiol-disulfide isomerase or thioredoxin n=1 Tax=Aneurinibacillus thermoaerophilus TaxID=143495 RepID=A0A1G7ZKE0_ANETH|nr:MULTISPECIES: TlpA disulfide reductase family protein [Aneurinibacillus]AMA72421.1 hypothetical protein ACH33_05870 [Aneurinibacillus sp. XH2]MED0679896.1 TlpA disulfide reductase family protein [Aneurinibacillus thermoaerophilus]MED0735601.1 TlpA disulfide reductase family protein [Aneurinibacillus thermoaerophilus]MED0763705.1 TlpA disulfide reductase family protein [Aneurinibacillus thermoaerophilus]QYY41824.1 TlpA family protein disulfide reductase [Aneurinibacillus thermoaerophilus]